MPSAAHVAWAKFRVSAMIVCAAGIASVLVFLLLGGSEFLQPSASIHSYLVDLSGLTKGSPVRFNGIRVGTVTRTELSHLKDPKRIVRADMSIVQHFLRTIPEDSTVQVIADNVLGDPFANINEGHSPQPLRAGGDLQQTPSQQINMADLMTAARAIISSTDALLSDIQAGRGNLGEFVKGEAFYNDTLKKVSQFQRQVREMTARDTKGGRLLYDESMYEELQAPVKRLNQELAELESGQGTGGRFLKDTAQYDQLRKTVAELNRELAELAAGKGQAGKLLKDDELYLRLTRTIGELNRQVDAVNSGEGALGQLMVSSQLYEGLSGSTKNLQNTLKEFRENPKKFLRFKVF
ncbi:MAG: MlaD family protein [Acidobacteriia bacterium]|nr:MlaD family protein [Terriglobia bacterium]